VNLLKVDPSVTTTSTSVAGKETSAFGSEEAIALLLLQPELRLCAEINDAVNNDMFKVRK